MSAKGSADLGVHERSGSKRPLVERLAWLCVTRRGWVLTAVALLTLALVPGLGLVRSDNSIESFLAQDDPALGAYRDFQSQFGQDQFVLILVRPTELFSVGALEKLRELHRRLERDVPHVAEVTSLINARDVRGEGGGLDVGKLLEKWPETPADLAVISARARANPTYRGILLNEDASATAILLEPVLYSSKRPQGASAASTEDVFAEAAGATDRDSGDASAAVALLSDQESEQLIAAVQAIVAESSASDFELDVLGAIPNSVYLNGILSKDAAVSLLGSLVVNALILLLLFGRLSAVVVPLAAVLLAVIGTFGVMGYAGIPMSSAVVILPRIVVVVTLCNTIHILTIALQQARRVERKEEAIVQAVVHTGLPVALACLTTALGFLSFSRVALAQVANLGQIAPVGVAVALLYSVTFVPAALAFAPLPRPNALGVRISRALGTLLARIGRIGTLHPRAVLAVSGAALLIAGLGVTQLRLAENVLHYYPEDDPVRTSAERFEREFGGAYTIEVVVDTGRPDGLKSPETLLGLDRAVARLAGATAGGTSLGKTTSILDIAKETHQALHEDRPEFYRVAEDADVLAQEMFLFESSGPQYVAKVSDSSLRVARVSIRVPSTDIFNYLSLVETVETTFGTELPGSEIRITGAASLFSRTARLLAHTLVESYGTALLMIGLVLILALRSLRLGLLACVPNLLPIVLTLGFIGWIGIPLNTSTLLVGAIVLGLAVDDTLHFMHRFLETAKTAPTTAEAVRSTLETTGAALFVTSLVMSLGFLMSLAAYLSNVQQFGVIAAVAAATALVSDVLIAPALVTLFAPVRAASASSDSRRDVPAAATTRARAAPGWERSAAKL